MIWHFSGFTSIFHFSAFLISYFAILLWTAYRSPLEWGMCKICETNVSYIFQKSDYVVMPSMKIFVSLNFIMKCLEI